MSCMVGTLYHYNSGALHGVYYATSFGCYTSSSGNLVKDPGDNCIPGCPNIIGGAFCPNASSGPACESALKWFAADAARYSCGARLRVTNPKNGKSVVVVAIDNGPSCSIESKVKHAALDLSYPSTTYLFGEQQGIVDRSAVNVVEVSASTPLGPSGSADGDPGNGDMLPGDPAPGPGDPAPDPGNAEPDPGNGDPAPGGAEEPPAANEGGCGAVDYAGKCTGQMLQFCENDELVSFACKQGCGCDSEHALYDCGFASPAGDSSKKTCDEIGLAGTCDGNTLRSCEQGGLVEIACGAYGRKCGIDPATKDFADCL